MKILILDNCISRRKHFKKHLKAHECIYAQSYEEFKQLLNQAYDLIFLDHDLGTVETGLDCARLIAQLSHNLLPIQVIIHSHNVSGAKNMEDVLVRASIPVNKVPLN
jgi:DNA-binding response OmpR family regulator